ncbi:hypothetical protein FRB98_006464 [Tulasnella sp. 332]|nr:hypothetical protein FRB98_006464 [Tulasnella sp. 332]
MGVSSSATPEGLSLDKQHYIKGHNLKDDVRYVTTWHYAGMTNDFIVFCNLIYLGVISQRIPILPPFAPAGIHVGAAAAIDFSEIFDLPALSKAIQWPILEWSDVKRAKYNESIVMGDSILPGVERDKLGCWSTWAMVDGSHRAAHSVMPQLLALDIVYTSVPRSTKLTNTDDPHVTFSGLASILMPQGRVHALDGTETLSTMSFEDRMEGNVLEPDDQLACFDLLYFVSAKAEWEWSQGVSPVWSLIGTHARFTPRIEGLADQYLRSLFHLGKGATIPKFVTVHIRRTDFKDSCPKDLTLDECLAPLSAYERRVAQVKSIIKVRPGEPMVEVIVASDEREASWWEAVGALGWKHIDHIVEETVEKYPGIIDAAILSRGAGFVGTAQSTMSLVADKRVKDWGNGPARNVRWGWPGADES